MSASRIYLAGEWREGATLSPVLSPYDGHGVAEVHRADESHFTAAIDKAVEAARIMAELPTHRIAAALETMKQYVRDHADEAANILAEEAGKPLTLARIEVQRTLHVIEDGVEECKRPGGELLVLDRRPWGDHATGSIERFPRGVMGAITPFNFPLHLVAHKIIPAIASRNALIVKPASQTPLSALLLARAFDQTDLPKGALSVLPGSAAAAAPLITDDRVKGISFTGSSEVGWGIKARAVRKHVSLELGGNAGAIVHEDTDIERAAKILAGGSFAYAGQSCISTQRIYVHEMVFDKFTELFKTATEALVVGDPHDETAMVGPLISADDTARVAAWVDEAIAGGAKLLTGGRSEGAVYWPTILIDTKPEMNVNCREIFGPVVTVSPYSHFDDALAMVNDSEFGLQAGVFTNDVNRIRQAYNTLEVGGVIINNAPTWRIDHMPYGGVKGSGEGREGVRYAMEAMSEPRLLVVHYPQ